MEINVRDGWRRGGGGGRGGGHGWRGGGEQGVVHLAPVIGAAVTESQDALRALGDVEGASGAGVRHGDVPQAVFTAAPLQLLIEVTLCRSA